jgi:DNA (cytosine-5)-methyltransferase 1
MKDEPLKLVLSLFPGIGLLDKGFEACGFCVVRGPDTLWGGDIREFHPPASHFCGIIGGPPCQNFSAANRKRDRAGGMELVNEFLRTVREADPEWWLMENVPGSPVVTAPGFHVQLFMLDASHVGSRQHRLRKFHFGFKTGRELVIGRTPAQSQPGTSQPGTSQPTCLASEARRGGRRRTWADFCELQGLPCSFTLPGFTVEAAYRAVGNGVPYQLALALAQAIDDRDRAVTPHRVCECGCGRFVTGRARLAGVACRKRQQRIRDLAGGGPQTPALL